MPLMGSYSDSSCAAFLPSALRASATGTMCAACTGLTPQSATTHRPPSRVYTASANGFWSVLLREEPDLTDDGEPREGGPDGRSAASTGASSLEGEGTLTEEEQATADEGVAVTAAPAAAAVAASLAARGCHRSSGLRACDGKLQR